MNQKSPEAFRTISEVAEWLGVPTHVLRFWESRFSQVKPVKRAGGRRYYRPSDMELLGGIRKLLHEDGMTIRGVQKLLREEGVKYIAALSPSLESGADIGDAIGSNVVALSGRREPAEELVIEDAELVPEPEPAAEPEPEVSAASAPATAAGRPDDSPDLSEEFPSPEALEFIAHEAEPDTFETASELPDSPRPAAGIPEPVTDPADPMSSPEALDFAAHDALPEGAWAEDAPEAADAAGAPQADLADAGEADILPAPARPALVLPDIGPDPADDAGTTGAPRVAAHLRAARDAKAEPPVAALQALANRLEGLSIRMRQSAAPHRPL